MTITSRKVSFEHVLYIKYPVQFCQKNNKDKNVNIKALIDLDSKVNIMHPINAIELRVCARKFDVGK